MSKKSGDGRQETVPPPSRDDAKAYGVVLDSHGKIGWGRSDIGGDPIVVS